MRNSSAPGNPSIPTNKAQSNINNMPPTTFKSMELIPPSPSASIPSSPSSIPHTPSKTPPIIQLFIFKSEMAVLNMCPTLITLIWSISALGISKPLSTMLSVIALDPPTP